MSETYPGIKASMGEKDGKIIYYMIKMRAQDLANKMETSKTVDPDASKLVDKMVQRSLKEKRSTGDISRYLSEAHTFGERFMGSFVVATFGGAPKWYPIPLDKKHPTYEFFKSDINDFGLIKFDGTQKYFVLDGQHRLTSLKSLFGLLPDLKNNFQRPPGLVDDELSVLVISNIDPTNEEKTLKEDAFRKRLRRVFTVLNRHAKQTSKVENISMDEDDIAAIHTRRLLNEIELFKWSGDDLSSAVVDINNQQLKEGVGHLTTIATIYEMNKIFLKGIDPLVGEDYFKFSPGQKVVDEKFKDIKGIWELLIKTIDGWKDADRGKMKNHTPKEDREGDGTMDHLLFWPVGQIGLAFYIVDVIQKELQEGSEFDISMVKKALKDINKIDWDLFSGPWYGYTLHKVAKVDQQNRVGKYAKGEPDVKHRMFASGSSPQNIADMIGFLKGEFASDKKSAEIYRDEWEGKLRIYKSSPEQIEKLWNETLSVRKKIAGI
ncbi:MAG: hypothetical protein CMQ60_03930 [Gammaproteobacteria bacterium]|nr:hypothetical protein [Gammaproteobacteria bacterium]|tara:strand:+ start:298 stop:1770 length:1473 start_codon:yes stop_codon:yes gene_type:complete